MTIVNAIATNVIGIMSTELIISPIHMCVYYWQSGLTA